MNYKFHFENDILFLEFKTSIKFEDIINAIADIKSTFPEHKIRIVAYKDLLGYWNAHDFDNSQDIYCGGMSVKDTKGKIKKYLDNEES